MRQSATFPCALPVISFPEWRGFTGLLHGFLGRVGGVSRPPFDALNLSYDVGDDPASVKENWRICTGCLTAVGAGVVVPKQVHGTEVLKASPDSLAAGRPADAVWTDRAGLVVGVLTADCVPILLAEPARRISAAVHAGWRGTSKEIAMKVVEVLWREEAIVPSSLFAVLGPAISDCCYTVGMDLFDAFPSRWRQTGWTRTGDGWRLDLREINRIQLQSAGLGPERICVIGPCTSCQAGRFFSHRSGRGLTGRQLSFVGWEK